MAILFIVMGSAGCGSKAEVVKDQAITSITLVCADLCKELSDPPFNQKVITEVEELKTFKHAIDKAKIMQGDLDYGVVFLMSISYSDHTQQEFVLNVDNEDGRTALLVDRADSGQGYEIPPEPTSALRKMIYARSQ
ncbi:hypothetical protein GZH47_21150 [Paenibacillus rhizovicinus]|uniref:Uncharacterized protein n=1 Tax=Paenibacillus rhizovicinus TaxID=2704463 RepID=A0A6C0P3B4_9BACL|nr:hypothetical protein [Paenibacillus rhizovicinus]QHW33060.1 hypothetical protein GZH47_21150 [Paenibacillus rhizovicinus]